MSRVSLLRLDRVDSLAPGNKLYKLHEALAQAHQYDALMSFGGAWSNHLHALAAMGNARGLRTIGVVRGERPERLSAMLSDVERWGMKLVFVSRSDYRKRYELSWQQALSAPYGRCLIIPEGGADLSGVRGCRAIGDLLSPHLQQGDKVMLAVGTGATLAGILASDISRSVVIEGVSVLKGTAKATNADVNSWLSTLAAKQVPRWRIRDDAHEGGYAKVSPGLRAFVLNFEAVHGIPLEPVYTGKLLYRIYLDIQQGLAPQRIVAVHTGGLQGRRGYDF